MQYEAHLQLPGFTRPVEMQYEGRGARSSCDRYLRYHARPHGTFLPWAERAGVFDLHREFYHGSPSMAYDRRGMVGARVPGGTPLGRAVSEARVCVKNRAPDEMALRYIQGGLDYDVPVPSGRISQTAREIWAQIKETGEFDPSAECPMRGGGGNGGVA